MTRFEILSRWCSKTTADVILRALVNLNAEDSDTFFDEPKLDPQDLLRIDDRGAASSRCF
ncbi:helicase HerA-like domain-containing protein [Mycobacterium lepromatosis]|uniref:helicase HerA-like domain-containing protein n=1 Tax=Mycobacterium lepromatosis TaxID=480418 RepID=UPI0006962710